MIFECRHNIRNKLVSTAIESPNSFPDITSIRTHQHFGKILKDNFFVYSRQYDTQMNTTHRQILFCLLVAFVFIY